MKITKIDFFRDGSTGGIEVELDNGTHEQYLVHGHNFGNSRMDVTKGAWHVQDIPTVKELDDLTTALYELKYDPEFDYWKSETQYMKNAYILLGMIQAYRYYLSNTKDEIVPVTPPVYQTSAEIEAEAVDKMSNELAKLMDAEIMDRIINTNERPTFDMYIGAEVHDEIMKEISRQVNAELLEAELVKRLGDAGFASKILPEAMTLSMDVEI